MVSDPAVSTVAIVLAAGRGVRMGSSLPKVLHPVGRIPMVRRVVDAVRAAGIGHLVVVVPPEAPSLIAVLPPEVTLAVQPEARGTGDAVAIGLGCAGAADRVLVVGGDTPLVTPALLRDLAGGLAHGTIVMATAHLPNPRGYGRVVLGADRRVQRIVEEADASPEERSLSLVNGMVFAFDAAWLRESIKTLKASAGGEVYLTSLVESATAADRIVEAVEADDPWAIVGVNSRTELAAVESALRDRVNRRWIEAGVTLVDPASTFIDEAVVLASDVVVHPHCYLRGQTLVGEGSTLGPGAEIIDSSVGAGARVSWSVVEGATIGERVCVGPYCRIRPGTRLDADVALGSFAEVKNSVVGARTQMHHFGYLGDAIVGPDVNIGAGAITCNFDGVEKHETVIEAGVFVGSDTMLVAPVTLGEGSRTGAGAVVTHDVAPGKLVVGVPARPVPGRGRRRPGTSEPVGRANAQAEDQGV